MASFAKIENGIVTMVVSVVNEVLHDANGVEQEEIGVQFLKNLYNEPDAIWKQTSYNTSGGVHSNGKTPLRKNHAAIGYTYNEEKDAFILPKPFNSWILNEDTCRWDPPIPMPELTKAQIENQDIYIWNEENQSWDFTNFSN